MDEGAGRLHARRAGENSPARYRAEGSDGVRRCGCRARHFGPDHRQQRVLPEAQSRREYSQAVRTRGFRRKRAPSGRSGQIAGTRGQALRGRLFRGIAGQQVHCLRHLDRWLGGECSSRHRARDRQGDGRRHRPRELRLAIVAAGRTSTLQPPAKTRRECAGDGEVRQLARIRSRAGQESGRRCAAARHRARAGHRDRTCRDSDRGESDRLEVRHRARDQRRAERVQALCRATIYARGRQDAVDQGRRQRRRRNRLRCRGRQSISAHPQERVALQGREHSARQP